MVIGSQEEFKAVEKAREIAKIEQAKAQWEDDVFKITEEEDKIYFRLRGVIFMWEDEKPGKMKMRNRTDVCRDFAENIRGALRNCDAEYTQEDQIPVDARTIGYFSKGRFRLFYKEFSNELKYGDVIQIPLFKTDMQHIIKAIHAYIKFKSDMSYTDELKFTLKLSDYSFEFYKSGKISLH